MATPTSPSLKEHAAAFAIGSVWSTAVAVGAGDGLTIMNDGGLQLRRPYQPAEELDAPVHKAGDLDVNDPVDFSPTFIARYAPGGLARIIAALFGADAVTTPGGTTPRLHTLTWEDNVRGIFGTFCVERPGKILEVPSAKVMGIDLSLQNGRLVGTAHLRGDDVKDNSTTNTDTQMDAVTALPFGERIRWAGGSVKMNAESGGDVGSETALQINSLDISLRRAFDGEHALGSNLLIEPEENAIDEFTVRLGFPRANAVNAAFFQTFKTEVLQKMKIAFVGGVIETTYYYEWNLFFPSLQIVEFAQPQAGVVGGYLLARGKQASANPTGMNQTRPYMTIQETETTDYLA